jgi:hypothetical protein
MPYHADSKPQYKSMPYHTDSKPQYKQVSYNTESKPYYNTDDRSKPFTDGQLPKICRYHLYFADRARVCKPWCRWPGAKPHTEELSSRSQTPYASRSPSPNPQYRCQGN